MNMHFLTDFAIPLILLFFCTDINNFLVLPWGVGIEVRPYFSNRDQDGPSEKRLLLQYLNI